MAHLIGSPEEVARDHYLVRLRTPGPLSQPGQFIAVKTGEGTDPLLRRPFSVFDHEGDVIEIVVRVVGRGTRLLSKAHDNIDVIGPLGKGFSLGGAQRALLVGGGVGCAPLYYLARDLARKNCAVTLLFGAATSEHIYCAGRYDAVCGDFRMATDDGSRGFKGQVTALMEEVLSRQTYDRIYTCGPTPMMKRVVELSGNVPVEISVENYFGCGFGICAGCTIETSGGLRRACVHGPVFDGKSVLFDSLE
jgi:dihydroorotate dehydrogenase electron transfer subunit